MKGRIDVRGGEFVKLLASASEQLRCEREGLMGHVPTELICGYCDDLFIPKILFSFPRFLRASSRICRSFTVWCTSLAADLEFRRSPSFKRRTSGVRSWLSRKTSMRSEPGLARTATGTMLVPQRAGAVPPDSWARCRRKCWVG